MPIVSCMEANLPAPAGSHKKKGVVDEEKKTHTTLHVAMTEGEAQGLHIAVKVRIEVVRRALDAAYNQEEWAGIKLLLLHQISVTRELCPSDQSWLPDGLTLLGEPDCGRVSVFSLRSWG